MNAALATVIVGVLSLLGTLAGSLGGMKLISYRIEQLEKKVEKHNSIIERTFKLEEKTEVQSEQIKVANHRIEDLEKETDNLREKIK
jgi:DNA repair ATPase RecN